MSFIGSQHYQDFWTEVFSIFAICFFFASCVAAVDCDDESFALNHARFLLWAKCCAIIAFALAVISLLRHMH